VRRCGILTYGAPLFQSAINPKIILLKIIYLEAEVIFEKTGGAWETDSKHSKMIAFCEILPKLRSACFAKFMLVGLPPKPASPYYE
jgi:hypothetical protein